ncbi:hypothetical protein D9M68_815200 [compost metagenome]
MARVSCKKLKNSIPSPHHAKLDTQDRVAACVAARAHRAGTARWPKSGQAGVACHPGVQRVVGAGQAGGAPGGGHRRGLRGGPGPDRRRDARPDRRHGRHAAGQPGGDQHGLVEPPDAAGQVPQLAFAAQGCGADPVPLRRFRRLLRAVARSAPGVFVRLFPHPRADAGRGPGGQAGPHLPQTAAAARRALP